MGFQLPTSTGEFAGFLVAFNVVCRFVAFWLLRRKTKKGQPQSTKFPVTPSRCFGCLEFSPPSQSLTLKMDAWEAILSFWGNLGLFSGATLTETNGLIRLDPKNRPGPKRKFIFQPLIFRGYVSFREGMLV